MQQQQGGLLDADDLFSDLIGSSVLKSSSKPGPQASQPGSSGPSSSNQPVRISSAGHAGPREPVLPEPDLLDTALAKPSSNGSGGAEQPSGAAVSKEELKEVVTEVVQGVVEASLSKFVRSLRTVLEDMGRRIDATGHAANTLKESVEQLREHYESQAGNMHARFTAVDLAVKEVERGVQSLRDKQELVEAQAMLAKLSSSTPRGAPEQPHSKGTPGADAAKHERAAATPTAASAGPAPAALAPAASAPPAAAAPAAAPVLAPPSLPQSAPPAPAVAPVAYAPPAAAVVPVPQAPPAAAGVPCAPPMAPGPPPPQQQQQAQYGPPPPAPYAAPPGPPPPGPPAYQQAPPMPPPQQQQQQQPASSSYMQMPPGPPPPPQMQQQQPMAPPPGAGPPPPPGYGPGPGPHHMGPPPPGAGPPATSMYGPPPGHMQGSSGPQYPSAPSGAYPPPFRTPSGPPQHGGRPGGGVSGAGGPPQMASSMLPLDKIVSDIVAMGFSHGQVMGVVRQLQSSGQALEMNVIIDKLMAQSR